MSKTITWKQIKDTCQYLVKDTHGLDSPIQCIKEVRAFTGMGLKEAKDLVDGVRDEHVGKGADAASVYAAAMRDDLLSMGFLVLAGGATSTADVGSAEWVHDVTAPTTEDELNMVATVGRHMTAQSLMIGRLLEAIKEQNELLKDLVEAVAE